MALYRLVEQELHPLPPTTFESSAMHERRDLQPILRDNIGVLGDDLLVIAEEFGVWEDANRRIDLLALDRSGSLVVIELKRTFDGGHADLQALRYAAMVAPLDLDGVVEAHRHHRSRLLEDPDPETARAAILDWLRNAVGDTGDGNPVEPEISSDVRIILVAAGFSRELTTTVLWLRDRSEIDIRCVELRPHALDDGLVIETRQLVPLPEAGDFQVRLRRKEVERARREEAARSTRDYTRFVVRVSEEESGPLKKRGAVLRTVQALCESGIDIESIATLFPNSQVRRLEGILATTEEIDAAMRAAEMKRLDRWFIDAPFHSNGTTILIGNQWGTDTEELLRRLTEAFPSSGVTVLRADEG